MAYSIKLNGTDLSGTNYGLTVVEHDYSGYPEARVEQMDLAGGDGAVVKQRRYGSRPISFECVVTSGGNLQGRLDNLVALFEGIRAGGTEVALIHDWRTDRQFKVVTPTMGRVEPLGDGGAAFELEFVCPYPWAEGTALATASANIAGTSGSVDVPGTGTVGGNYFAAPEITIQQGTASAFGTLVVANPVTGESLSWVGELPANWYMRIDSDSREYVEWSSNGSTWNNATNGVRSGAQFPRLQAGTQNSITVDGLGTDGGDVTVIHRARYLR